MYLYQKHYRQQKENLIHIDIVDITMIMKRDYFGYPQGIILQNFVGS